MFNFILAIVDTGLSLENNVKVMIGIFLVSVLHYIINLRKQKQDLWELRWAFYEELRKIYGPYGFYWYVREYYRLKKGCTKNLKETSETRNYEKLASEHRKKADDFFPSGMSLGTDYVAMISFDIIYERANFLFDSEIKNFLKELSPQNKSGLLYDETFPNFDAVWTQEGFADRFNKYLKL